MTTTRVAARTSVAPGRFIGVLTDFTEKRWEVFDNSRPGFFTLHERGDTWADVTEGSPAGGGIWQRYRYDWATPGTVRLEVLDSNAFGPGSFWEYVVTPDGTGSRIELTIKRVPVTFRYRLVDLLLGLVGGPLIFGKDLRKTLAKLESQPA